MSAQSWVRLWAGTTTDPKWQTIARKSGQPRALVIALFAHLMLEANEAEQRGSVSAIDVEDCASAMDCDEDQIVAILDAMEGRVIADGQLSGWAKRQPAREESDANERGALTPAERKRNQRERERNGEKPLSITLGHAPSRDVTRCHAPEAEAEAEAENPTQQAAAITQPPPARDDPAAAGRDPVTSRALELTALLRQRGAAVQPGNPHVRRWAESGVTDAQALTALETADRRRCETGSANPVNAGLLNAILADVQATERSPPRRRSLHEERAATLAALTGRNRNRDHDDEHRIIDITPHAAA